MPRCPVHITYKALIYDEERWVTASCYNRLPCADHHVVVPLTEATDLTEHDREIIAEIDRELTDRAANTPSAQPLTAGEITVPNGVAPDYLRTIAEDSANMPYIQYSLRLAADELQRLTAELVNVKDRLARYDDLIGAEMPPDLKCWHQNSKEEWPEVAAWCLRTRGERLAEAEQRIEELESELAKVREESERSIRELEAHLGKALRAHESSEAVLHMAVARLGGTVEEHPTARHNFLQRVDELRQMEFELANRIAELERPAACLRDLIAWLRDPLTDFFGNEMSEDIMPILVKHGLAERVLYDPEKHGEVEAEPGEDMIWRFTP